MQNPPNMIALMTKTLILIWSKARPLLIVPMGKPKLKTILVIGCSLTRKAGDAKRGTWLDFYITCEILENPNAVYTSLSVNKTPET
jgi:hypothetical protein